METLIIAILKDTKRLASKAFEAPHLLSPAKQRTIFDVRHDLLSGYSLPDSWVSSFILHHISIMRTVVCAHRESLRRSLHTSPRAFFLLLSFLLSIFFLFVYIHIMYTNLTLNPILYGIAVYQCIGFLWIAPWHTSLTFLSLPIAFPFWPVLCLFCSAFSFMANIYGSLCTFHWLLPVLLRPCLLSKVPLSLSFLFYSDLSTKWCENIHMYM